MNPTHRDIDPFQLELMKSCFDTIADDMALTLMRTAHSGIVRDSLDFSTALLDADGLTLAQGICTPMHMGSFYDAMRKLIAQYDQRIDPGDVFILQRPLRRRRPAPARHLHHDPGFHARKPNFGEPAGRMGDHGGAPLRCGRDRRRQQRARRRGDIPGRVAAPDREVHGPRRAEPRAVGRDCAQRAHPGEGDGRPAGAARRVQERRARNAGAGSTGTASIPCSTTGRTSRTMRSGSPGRKSPSFRTGSTSSPITSKVSVRIPSSSW